MFLSPLGKNGRSSCQTATPVEDMRAGGPTVPFGRHRWVFKLTIVGRERSVYDAEGKHSSVWVFPNKRELFTGCQPWLPRGPSLSSGRKGTFLETALPYLQQAKLNWCVKCRSLTELSLETLSYDLLWLFCLPPADSLGHEAACITEIKMRLLSLHIRQTRLVSNTPPSTKLSSTTQAASRIQCSSTKFGGWLWGWAKDWETSCLTLLEHVGTFLVLEGATVQNTSTPYVWCSNIYGLYFHLTFQERFSCLSNYIVNFWRPEKFLFVFSKAISVIQSL